MLEGDTTHNIQQIQSNQLGRCWNDRVDGVDVDVDEMGDEIYKQNNHERGTINRVYNSSSSLGTIAVRNKRRRGCTTHYRVQIVVPCVEVYVSVARVIQPC